VATTPLEATDPETPPPKLGKSFKSNDGLLAPPPPEEEFAVASFENPFNDDPNAFASESPPEVWNKPKPPGLDPRLRNEDVEDPLAPGAEELEFADVVDVPSISLSELVSILCYVF
jgi:hypothetical protein